MRQIFIDVCLVGILGALAIVAVCLIINVLLDIEELRRFEKGREGKK